MAVKIKIRESISHYNKNNNVKITNKDFGKMLAEKLGKNHDQITNSLYPWMNGSRECSHSTIKVMCEILNVSSDYMIGLKEKP